ncbi:MAG: hypothetical protein WBL50_17345 [Candidatus Acidiferrum sp.]
MKNQKNLKSSDFLRREFRSVVFFTLASAMMLAARTPAQQPEEQPGIDQGNYNIKQSVEFGGRFTSVSGNEQTYDTMVNLQQGPRLLNFTTDMHSLDPRGSLLTVFISATSATAAIPMK